MQRRLVLLTALAASLLFVVACSGSDSEPVETPTRPADGAQTPQASTSTPEPESDILGMLFALMPEGRAPGGLDELTLPTDAEEATSLLQRLPPEVAGVTRDAELELGSRRFKAIYGTDQPDLARPLEVMAIDFVGSALGSQVGGGAGGVNPLGQRRRLGRAGVGAGG